MQNQAAVEALYSATFIEDYLDTVENLPDDAMKHFSMLREYDLSLKREFLDGLEELMEEYEREKHNMSAQKAILAKIQKGLICAQEIGDDKLSTMQTLADLVENKARRLEHDAQNLEFDDQDNEAADEPVERAAAALGSVGASTTGSASPAHSAAANATSASQTPGGKGSGGGGAAASGSSASGSASTPSQAGGSGSGGHTGASGKKSKNRTSTVHETEKEQKPTKRRKKQQEKNYRGSTGGGGNGGQSRHQDDRDDEDVPSLATTSSSRSSSKSRGGGGQSSSAKKQSSASGSGSSATKRKQTKRAMNHDRDDSDRELDLSNIEIDPDEPTYCLCDQVSYGDMIGCDNDLCPIEWFHFNCVQLSTKPKGKWYCPKCRGDKPTVMKPKAQFLKELEKYNKEREEKLMKQNS